MSSSSSPTYALVGRRAVRDEEDLGPAPELKRAQRWVTAAGCLTAAGILVALAVAGFRLAAPAPPPGTPPSMLVRGIFSGS